MNTLILLAGGTGSRMGNIGMPKQYLEVHGEPIIAYALQTFQENAETDRILIVADEMWHTFLRNLLNQYGITKFAGFALPGVTRQHSIRNGLDLLREMLTEKDNVIIHDAARPFISEALINACYDALKEHEGVMPVLSAKDTFYYSEGGQKPEKLLRRSALFAGQAPEAFRFAEYDGAIHSLSEEELSSTSGTTEVAMRCGLDVTMIPGDEKNFKVTTMEDLRMMEMLLNKDT